MDMFNGTIRHQEAMFKIQIGAVVGCPIQWLLHNGNILWMNSLQYLFDPWFCRWIKPNNSVGFVWPEEFPTGNIPAKTTGQTEPLGFS